MLIPSSMGTQNTFLKSYFQSATHSIQSPKTQLFPSNPAIFSSKIRSLNWEFSEKVPNSLNSHTLPSRFVLCRNSIDRVDYKGVSDAIEDTTKPKIRRKNLAVFVSGGGSNFRSIYEATLNGAVLGDVVVLVTNKPDCGGAEYSREKGIPVIIFPKSKNIKEGFLEEDLVTALRSYKVDFVLLAGYLKLIPTSLIRAYPKSVLNIHPSLLPAFGGKGYYGMKVHKAVIASGARYSGPTIHYVDEHYDTGRILAQIVVPVLANDTPDDLAARVLHQEHKLYVEVAAALCEERITWREDGVPLIKSKEYPYDYR